MKTFTLSEDRIAIVKKGQGNHYMVVKQGLGRQKSRADTKQVTKLLLLR